MSSWNFQGRSSSSVKSLDGQWRQVVGGADPSPEGGDAATLPHRLLHLLVGLERLERLLDLLQRDLLGQEELDRDVGAGEPLVTRQLRTLHELLHRPSRTPSTAPRPL
jgi:hypothetical protein